MSGQKSDNVLIEFGVQQGSVLGPLLFLIHINDLNEAIKFSRVHHFPEDTNLLLVDNSLKKINKHISHNLNFLTAWLTANRSLNTSKTEILLFRPKSKRNITKHLNVRISGQYIPQKTQVKYLCLTIIDEHLDWDLYFSQLKKKLNHGIGLLTKIKHLSPEHLLKTLDFSLFNSNLIHGCQK